MRVILRLLSVVLPVLAIATSSALPARAADTCPFISDQQLRAAMPALKWSLISNQDGRGCIYSGGQGDTMMLTVFRNPTAERAQELYAQFTTVLAERMTTAPVADLGQQAQAGATQGNAPRAEAAVVTRAGEYLLQVSVYPIGRPASDALLKPMTDVARVALGNVGKTSERFGGCEWLTAADADGFLDKDSLTIQRTGAGSCMMFDAAANTMIVAVVAMSRDTQVNMQKRGSPCQHVALPELAPDAFGEHSCTKGNANAVTIWVWKNGRQASIVFAPVKPHPESGSVAHLKEIAARVYGKL